MKSIQFAIAGFVAGAVQLMSAGAMAGPALDEVLQNACSRTKCTVRENPGGEIAVFKRAARELVSEGKRLVIDGRCASACVVLADLARANTCVTGRAEMAVHQSLVVRFTGPMGNPTAELVRREDPPQSSDIDRWVKRHGGYPTEGVLVMPVSEARKFWSAC